MDVPLVALPYVSKAIVKARLAPLPKLKITWDQAKPAPVVGALDRFLAHKLVHLHFENLAVWHDLTLRARR